MEDLDKTVIHPSTGLARPGGEAITPVSGAPFDHSALAVGTRIGEFEILRLVGVGGFGIVYCVHDHSLGRDVALKEYMPSALAERLAGMTVRVKSQQHMDTFAAGLSSFINEARLLAQFDHPSLVKVYRFWEANGTAYMVMPFYEGPTLKQALHAMGAAPSEEWIKTMLTPLLDALSLLHGANCFHRDVAPDNILLLQGGRPVLLDFGAARRVIGDLENALTVIVKPGYAPVEQYAEVVQGSDMRQGAWTDIYALAATVHFAIMGERPPSAVARLVNDHFVPLQKAAAGRYTPDFLRVLDRALAVKPQQRPQSIAELRTALGLPSTLTAQAATVQVMAPAAEVHTAGRPGSAKPWMAMGAVAALLVAGGGYAFFTQGARDLPPSVKMESTVKTEPPAPLAPAVRGRVTPDDLLNDVFLKRDPDLAVSVLAEKSRVQIKRDVLGFSVRSAVPGYLYVWVLGTEGSLNLLFPNAVDANNQVQAGTEVKLPGAKWQLSALGPRGTNHFLVVVSQALRNLESLGLNPAGPFKEAPKDLALRLGGGVSSGLMGTADCAAQANCSDHYGAARFSIEEVD